MPNPRRTRLVTAAAALASVAGALLIAGRLGRRLEIEGESMLPTLAPGDRVLVLSIGAPRPGDLVALRDPRRRDRIIVKRVEAIDADRYRVVGDNRAASTDSRTFGSVPRSEILGRVAYRYAPAARAGRVTTRHTDVPG